MAISKKVEDLVCKNCCFYQEIVGACGFKHLKPEKVEPEYFCGEYGEWLVEVQDVPEDETYIDRFSRPEGVAFFTASEE